MIDPTGMGVCFGMNLPSFLCVSTVLPRRNSMTEQRQMERLRLPGFKDTEPARLKGQTLGNHQSKSFKYLTSQYLLNCPTTVTGPRTRASVSYRVTCIVWLPGAYLSVKGNCGVSGLSLAQTLIDGIIAFRVLVCLLCAFNEVLEETKK